MHNVFVYLCWTCFNFFSFGECGHVDFSIFVFFCDPNLIFYFFVLNIFCLHLFLIFFLCTVFDGGFWGWNLKVYFFIFFTCVVFPSVVSGGFPPLSNQGTPLILSCPIGREQYEEVFCSCGRSFYFKLPSAWRTKRLKSYLNSFLLRALLLSSLHLFGENKPPGNHWWPLTWDRTRVAVAVVRSGLLAVAVVNRNA